MLNRFSIFGLFISICFLGIFAIDVSTEEINKHYSQSTYGGIGLIQTPSGRFSEDGEFLFGVSTESPYNRLFSKMQFFPWMEAVVRYTEGTYLPYNVGSHQTWKDKGLDLKFKIYESKDDQISIALGLNDIGGTGAYAGEYLVASKAFGDLDISLGIGWGKFGGVDHFDNFVSWIDGEREVRGGYEDLGGTINLKRFFSGDKVSIFGGIEYFTPIDNLSIKLEYDTSDYTDVIGREIVFDQIGDIFELDSRINYGVNYRINMSERDKLDLSVGYVRGNTIYANIAIHSNLNFSGKEKVIIGGEKIRNTNLPGGDKFGNLDENRKKFLTNRTIIEMARIGFVTHKITYNRDELLAEISQGRFKDTEKFIDLASRVLANNSPKNIKRITIINIDRGIETFRSTVLRSELISSVSIGPLNEELIEYYSYSPEGKDAIDVENEYLYPNFYWEIRPHLNNTIQHQERFFFWQLEALIHTEYSIKKGLYLTTDIGIDISNNFDEYTYHIPDGELHHVRQDRRKYLTEGKTGIRRMSLDYLIDINPNIKAKLSAGYLEWMYGGFGAEILYIPDNKRWGIGLDAYWVKQRDFDQRFSFREYQTLTGFLNYYQDIPFYNMRLKVSAGKFLAKDVGTMIDISRRFRNGARVGGFAALTNCDSECVGEGSFHKGIYFELPMDLFFIQSSTRQKTGYSWSPLTKDAGAKIDTGDIYSLMVNATDEIDSLSQKQWSLKKIFSGFSTKPTNRKL